VIDREKMVKLLMLTTSDNDPEALSAIRMANAHLKKSKVSWEEFLRGDWKVFVGVDMAKPEPKRPEPSSTLDPKVRKVIHILEMNDIHHGVGLGGQYIDIVHNKQSVRYWPIDGIALVDKKRHRWSMTTLMMYLRPRGE